jgi:hypothetical protein
MPDGAAAPVADDIEDVDLARALKGFFFPDNAVAALLLEELEKPNGVEEDDANDANGFVDVFVRIAALSDAL